MKKLFNRINLNAELLQCADSKIENIKTLPYYSAFGNEEERENDLKCCQEYKKGILNERQVLFENLQLEINKELNYLSQEMMKNNLL